MEGKLAILIKSIAEGEQQVEVSRKKLYESLSGNAEIAFKILDTFLRGTLSTKEFSDFLKIHGITVGDEEIQLILDYYDGSGNKVLTLKDFENAITPEINRQVKPPQIDANYKQIGQALLDFIMSELELLKNSLFLKKPLVEERLTTAHDYYKLIDKEEIGITHNLLAEFAEKQGIFLTNRDIIAFFRRVDREKQNRITFREFKNFVLSESIYDKKVLTSMFSERKSPLYDSSSFNYDPNTKKIVTLATSTYIPSGGSTAYTTGFQNSSSNFNSSLKTSGLAAFRSSYNPNYRSPLHESTTRLITSYESGRGSYLSKSDVITGVAKFKEDSWTNYSKAYPYYFGRQPDYQPPHYYDYYPYNHHLPSTKFYRTFDDYENTYHTVPYVPPYTYYKAYKDLSQEPYYSSAQYYRSRDYYGPYVYHSPYTGSLYPLRYSRYHYPELLARPTHVYRHELLKEDLHPYSKDYFIPYHRPRFYYRVYPREPQYYLSKTTGKRFYLGDDYINYYVKPVLEDRNQSIKKKSYFDDNMFSYETKPSTKEYYPKSKVNYANKIEIPYPNTNLYNSEAINWKYANLSSTKK